MNSPRPLVSGYTFAWSVRGCEDVMPSLMLDSQAAILQLASLSIWTNWSLTMLYRGVLIRLDGWSVGVNAMNLGASGFDTVVGAQEASRSGLSRTIGLNTPPSFCTLALSPAVPLPFAASYAGGSDALHAVTSRY